jgi:hypothetical protein
MAYRDRPESGDESPRSLVETAKQASTANYKHLKIVRVRVSLIFTNNLYGAISERR